MVEDRYARQALIEGWDQKRLQNGVVTIVGSDALAKYTALSLAALGVGTIRVVDAAPGAAADNLLDIPLQGDVRAYKLAEALKRINPLVNAIGMQAELTSPAAQYFLRGSTVVIDATNSIESKIVALDYARTNKVPCITAGANEKRGKVVLANVDATPVKYMPMFTGAEQGELVSMELGAVVAEEAKKVVMGLPGLILETPYDFNLEARLLFDHQSDMQTNGHDLTAFCDKKILLVGAGALGCFVGPASIYALAPQQFDVLDFDTIEEHNLNRQVCHYDAVGKLKAESMAKKLQMMVKANLQQLGLKGTKVTAITDKFTPDYKPKVQYDLIFDAVDSFYTKAMLHNYARSHGIPLISGGTDYRAATVLVYAPGKTSCLDCQIGLSDLAIKTEIIRRTSCLQAPNPSVVMTNQIAGAIMVAEARRVLRPDLYGQPTNGEIKYISDFESRGGVSPRDDVCNCTGTHALDLPDASHVEIKERTQNGKKLKEVYVDGKKI